MSVTMNGHDLQKGIETVANLTKLAANITDPNKQPKPQKQTTQKAESTNQPHTQTVEVKVGDQGEGKKPVIVKEKTETHIHKHFPDNRSLTDAEVELEKYRLDLEYAEKDKERAERMELEQYARKEREKLEEKAREAAEKRAEQNEKTRKRLLILGSVMAGIGLVGTGYYLYTDSRRNRGARLALPAQKTYPELNIPGAVSVEGEVK